jgi:partner of Y14 and mago protein
MEKLTKLEGWRQELKLLEVKNAEEASSWMLFC